ncbi:uncharacterized protein LOC134182399 [Corticium candelabrum]|uniref:uncharacterized protein LOC134182399 n=1 Tax=Corticium candelabrum TaxID=121492 RepID=UPI002E26965C|nr:uncharacterized protein LOC134182399 [Corticium candelabrum]
MAERQSTANPDDLYLRAEKLWNERNYVDAESSLHQLLLLNERAEHEPFKQARALYRLGACLYYQHKVNDAVKFTEQSLSIVRDIKPQHEKFLSKVLLQMGWYLYHQGKYERATEHLRESLNIKRKLSSVDKVMMAENCAYLSRCLLSQCLTKEAEDVMREGYGLAISTDDNGVKAEAATQLAYAIHLNEGTEKEVKKLLQQADGWIKMVGEEQGKAEVLSEMGEVLVIRGDYKRANRILQEAATIQRRFLPTNHWETALTLCRLAECQVKQDQQMAALTLFHESSEMMSKSIGVEHPIRGRSLFGVAKVLLRQQKWQEAETILKESVNILHPTTSAAIRDLNYCLRMLKKDQEAVNILQQHRVVSYHQVKHQASAFQVDDLQRELEQLRESNRAIQAEKSALLQQLADQEAVTRAVTDENERQVGEVRRLLQLMQERDENNKRLQNQLSTLTNQLDNKESRLQQQGGEIDVLRHEVQEEHTTNERLARDLQRSERAVQELERLQHQYDSLIQIHDDSLQMTGLKLGTGGYGEVGVGMWSGVAVAVKTFHEEPVRVTDFNISLIRREVSVSSRVHHPNVVSICGAIIDNEVPLRIVMELLEGSLKDVINAALRSRYLSMREQVDIAVGCLCGVMYLHQLQPAFLRGDICSTNILISKTMQAKIGDLGSCRFSNESLSVGPLSPQYIAPERVVEGRAAAPSNTTEADMYSLGVTFVELFTGVATERKLRERQFQAVPYVPLQDICYAMAEENPRDRISAAAALMQVNAVKQNDEYTSCPPKRMVKGKKHKEDKVTLVEMPWM